jgi:hypothetical protein
VIDIGKTALMYKKNGGYSLYAYEKNMWHRDCTNDFGFKGAEAVHVFPAHIERNGTQ